MNITAYKITLQLKILSYEIKQTIFDFSEQIDLSNPEIKDKSDSTVTLELKPLDDKAVR